MFLTESAAIIQADGKVPAALEQLWEEQNRANANSRELREKLIASKLNVGNHRANSSTSAQTVKPLSHNQAITSLQLGKDTCIIDLRLHCSKKFSEVLVGDVEQTELTIESIVGTALLEIFDTVHIDNVTVHHSPAHTMRMVSGNNGAMPDAHE